MRRHALIAALLSAALIAGCGGDSTGKPAPVAPTTSSLEIKNFLYVPDPVTVKANTKIAISNVDSAPHTLTEKGGSPSFDSGTIRGKAKGSVTFTKPGTYTYYCQFHATMSGTVTVVQ